MKTPSATPQPAPQAKSAKPSLAEQIAASKAQGGKPVPVTSVSGTKSKPSGKPETPEEQSKGVEMRANLVREWQELWKDRTSRIVLLGTAWTIALGIAGSAVFHSLKPVEQEKKQEPVPELVAEKTSESEETVTPEERYTIHRSIIEGVPYVAPKPEPAEAEKSREIRNSQPVSAKPQPVPAESKPNDAEKLRAKREEIATTGQLKVSTNPEDRQAAMEAIKEWSRQDAESANAKASKR